jgi:hypothetical protein
MPKAKREKADTADARGVTTKRDVLQGLCEKFDAEMKLPANLGDVRENYAMLVRISSGEIAKAMLEAALQGQVAPAKYLNEMVGLFPATDEASTALENSPTYTLMKKIGLLNDVTDGDDGQSSEITG